MARTTFVASARATKTGERPNCYTCHEPIEVGASYAWAQPSRFSMRYNWHTTCKAPRASALESNDKRAAAMAAFEDCYDQLDELRTTDHGVDTDVDTTEDDGTVAETVVESIKSILESCAEAVREAAELWRESASNIEDGFGHATSQSEEFESNADEVESVADEVESIDVPEYSESDWDSFEEWVDSTIDTVTEDVGSAEGNLP